MPRKPKAEKPTKDASKPGNELKKNQKISVNGGKRPGAGRKKGSPNKVTKEIRETAKQYGQEALDKFVSLMRESESEQVALSAAKEILDRAYGKSPQAHTGEDGEGPIKHEHKFAWMTKEEAEDRGWA